MQKKRILQIGIGLCVIISILALSCASGITPNVTNTASKYGGIFKRCYDVDANQLGDPVARPFVGNSYMITLAAIENLVRYDEKGLVVPWLATSWKVSPDLTSITITLQKGVKFHDGTDFNAEACKWNLERYAKSSNPELKAVKSVDVIDDSTVRLNLSEWSSVILDSLAYIPGLMISPTAFQKAGSTDKERSDWALKNPVGTGPFQLVSWQRDVKHVYKKFDGYWQKGKPYLEGIEFQIIADYMTRTAAFKRGEIEELNKLDLKDIKGMQQEKQFNVIVSDLSSQILCLAGDSAHPESPFADIRVRRAVDYAIDSKAIRDGVFSGIPKVTNQYASPSSWAYNSNVKGYSFDPNKAKQLLAEAGYPDGFKTKIIAPNWGTTWSPFALSAQEYLKKVGIIADIEPATQMVHMKYQTEGWKNSLLVLGGTEVLPDITRDMLVDLGLIKNNVMFPNDYTNAMNKASQAPDIETKKKYTQEALKVLSDNSIVNCFIAIPSSVWAINKRVHDSGIAKTISFHSTPEDTWIEK